MNGFVIFLFLIFYFNLSVSGAIAGTIGFNLECKIYESPADQENQIVIEGNLINTGNTKAYSPAISVFIDKWTDRITDFKGLEKSTEIDGGQKAFFKTQIDKINKINKTDFLPGKYTLILRLDCYEWSGVYRKFFYFFPFFYKASQFEKNKDALIVSINNIASINNIDNKDFIEFNIKKFWQKKQKLSISLFNDGSKAIDGMISICASDEFFISDYLNNFKLASKKQENKEMEIILEKSNICETKCFVILDYNSDNKHYSKLVKQNINITSKPVFFKFYAIFALLFFIIFAIIIIL